MWWAPCWVSQCCDRAHFHSTSALFHCVCSKRWSYGVTLGALPVLHPLSLRQPRCFLLLQNLFLDDDPTRPPPRTQEGASTSFFGGISAAGFSLVFTPSAVEGWVKVLGAGNLSLYVFAGPSAGGSSILAASPEPHTEQMKSYFTCMNQGVFHFRIWWISRGCLRGS